jgi:6,7-dimethyl-8-ribityllumazine synthase
MQRDAEKNGPPHILIVEARFYTHIADFLVQGAVAEIERRKALYSRIAVPGAFEIPAAIRMAMTARHGKMPDFDGFVALGCVIRGETSHYDYVCGESARGLMDLALSFSLAIGYGILTVENEAQALARARPDQKNKGRDAAAACLDMIVLRQSLATLE